MLGSNKHGANQYEGQENDEFLGNVQWKILPRMKPISIVRAAKPGLFLYQLPNSFTLVRYQGSGSGVMRVFDNGQRRGRAPLPLSLSLLVCVVNRPVV